MYFEEVQDGSQGRVTQEVYQETRKVLDIDEKRVQNKIRSLEHPASLASTPPVVKTQQSQEDSHICSNHNEAAAVAPPILVMNGSPVAGGDHNDISEMTAGGTNPVPVVGEGMDYAREQLQLFK